MEPVTTKAKTPSSLKNVSSGRIRSISGPSPKFSNTKGPQTGLGPITSK